MSAPRIPGLTYIQHIGQGGFADVFLYEQEWPRQRVAVKVVRPDVPLTEREKAMFTIEANAMARLSDHPYIVSVITAGVTSVQDGSRPYLVMRYCPPPDLGQRVQVKPMSVNEAVATGIKLASAIETAHRSGILHRDIKPARCTTPRPTPTSGSATPGHRRSCSTVDRTGRSPRTSTPSGRRSGTSWWAAPRSRSPTVTTPRGR